MRPARGSDATLPDSEGEVSETVTDATEEDRSSVLEDVFSTAFTCTNWALQVYVAVLLSESAELGVGTYEWVSAFVAAPLAANILAIICWLLYSPAKGFLRKLEGEPDGQVLVLLLGTISTDALALLSAHDEDRAIVRTLGLISNFLADIPFFAIELHLLLSGFSTRLIVASLIMNLLSIAVKLTRNWIILILSYNRWRRFRRVRAFSRRIGHNFGIEDAVALPFSLAFWLAALFLTAALSTRPLFAPLLAPALGSLPPNGWERELVACYYGAVAAFFVNAAVNGALWTAYLANPRFSHEWMLRSPLLSAMIGAIGLVDGCALNAFTQNAMWHARVLASGLLARLLAFDFPILVISWRAYATLTSAACLADESCAAFGSGGNGSVRALASAVPILAMVAVWWKAFRLVVCHVTKGTHGGDVGLEWRDAQLRPLSAEKSFALTLYSDKDDDDLDLGILAAEAAFLDEASAALVLPRAGARRAGNRAGRSDSAGAPPAAKRGQPGARGAASTLAQPLGERTTSLLFGAAETPDAELDIIDAAPPPLRLRDAAGAGGGADGRGGKGRGGQRRQLQPARRESDGDRISKEDPHTDGEEDEDDDEDDERDGRRAPSRGRARGAAERATVDGLGDEGKRTPASAGSGRTPRAASSSAGRRGANPSSAGGGADKKGRRKGRGRGRRGKERAGSAPANSRQAAQENWADEQLERRRRQRLQRGRNGKATRRRAQSEESSAQPIVLYHVWAAYQKVWGGSRWLGQLPMASLCVANLVRRLLLCANAWRMGVGPASASASASASAPPAGEDGTVAGAGTAMLWGRADGAGSSLISHLCLGFLVACTLASAVAAAAALRRGAAAQVRASLRKMPALGVLALTLGCFDPELVGALLEGFDALAVSCWSVLLQDVPWLTLEGLAMARRGGLSVGAYAGELNTTTVVHLALIGWKLLRIIVLALSRRSPPEATAGFFRHTRWGDMLPIVFSYSQLCLIIVLAVNTFRLVFRDGPFRRFDIVVGPTYTAATDALLVRYLLAATAIFLLGLLARLLVACYFLLHPGFAHRGIYRHSMFSSIALMLSLCEGSVLTALAKSTVSYKVFKMATTMVSLGAYDLPIALLHGTYYFGLVDFNQLGVAINGRGIEDLLRASAVVSVVCVLYRVFNLVLIKATLAEDDGARRNPFDDSALVGCLSGALSCCAGGPRGSSRSGSRRAGTRAAAAGGAVDDHELTDDEEEGEEADRRV